jgi:peptidoglycan/xylan/chitin deacetylase (PgdA/CDA1 family)
VLYDRVQVGVVANPRLTVWRKVEGVGRRVALTFDDCDAPDAWGRILDVLDDRATRATFFPLGMRIEEFPEIARRTVASGHAVGSHGYDHARFTELERPELQRQLGRDRRAWDAVLGLRPRLFRPPYGSYGADTFDVFVASGFRHMVLWDVDPRDWTLPGTEEIVHRILARVRSGSIVLLHVTDQTAEALGALIDGLHDRGLEPGSIRGLLPSR